MNNLTLTDRNKELALMIPKRYRFPILNAILAKSIENGSFIKELSLFLNEKELDEIISNLNIKVEIKKIENKKIYKPKISNISKSNKLSDSEKLFIGFED